MRPSTESSAAQLAAAPAPAEGPADRIEEPTAADGSTEGDPSMSTLFLNLGRRDNVRVGDIIRLFETHVGMTKDDLGRIRGLSAGWRTNDIGARLMSAIEGAKPLDQGDMPDREPKRPGLTKDAALVSDLLKLLLKIRAKESGVAARLIARSDDLEALAAGVRKNLSILHGWRFEQFGKDALDLVEGRLAFAIENGKLKMSRLAREKQEERVDA